MNTISNFEKKIKQEKNLFIKLFYGLILFLVLILNCLLQAFYLLFSSPYRSFNKYSQKNSNGIFNNSYTEHVKFKRKVRFFSASSFIFIVASALTVNLILLSLYNFHEIKPAYAATTRTWDGGGADTNWSTCANWSGDVCPGATDTVVFNGTSTKNAFLNGAFSGTVATMNVNSGYTGIITVSRAFIITTAFTQAAGTVNCGAQTVTLQGSFTLSGGTFNATTDTMYIGGNWTHTAGGTFDNKGGTVVFNPSADITIDVNVSETFANIQINNSTTSVKTKITSGDKIIATSNVNLTRGGFGADAAPSALFEVQGNLTMETNYTWAANISITMNGAADQSIIGVPTWAPSMAIQKATGNINQTGEVKVGYMAINLGTWNTNNYTLTIPYGIALTNASVFNAGSSIITLGASANGITLNSADSVYNHGSGTLSLGSLTINAGTFNNNTGAITVTNNFSMSGGTFSSAAGTFDVSGSCTISGGDFYASSVRTACNGFTHTLGGNYYHNNGTFRVLGGTIDVNGSEDFYRLNMNTVSAGTIITIASGDKIIANENLFYTNCIVNGGTVEAKQGVQVFQWFQGGDSTLTFTSTTDQTFTIDAGAAALFNGDIIINKTAGSVILTNALTMDAAGQDLTIQDGTLYLSGNNLTVNGILSNEDTIKFKGTESTSLTNGNDVNSGTCEYVGDGDTAADTYTLTTPAAFYNLKINSTDGATDLFQLGNAKDINGDLTITAGNFDVSANNYNLTIAGNFSRVGAFNQRSGNVIFDDAGRESIISGSTLFYNFTSATPAKTIKFTAGTTQEIDGVLSLTGSASPANYIFLRSTVEGSYWNIKLDGSANSNYVDVKDSDASTGIAINPGEFYTNSLHNVNWLFNFSPTAPTNLYSNSTANTAQAGLTNPTKLTDNTPVFSAIYTDDDVGDIANKYCIQVNANTGFDGTNLWYSDGASCATGSAITNITAGNRSTDIEYAGSALLCNTTYYWRIKFWDDTPSQGAWSSAANFKLNCAPTVADASGSVDEDNTFNGDLSHSDIEGDSVTYSIVTNGSHGTATITNTGTGVFNYVPVANYNGNDTFTYKVNDGFLDSNTATFTITINPINDAPTVADASASVNEDTTLNGDLSHTDIDNDPVTYSIVANGAHGTATITNTGTGVFNYVPAANYNGTDTFTYRVHDGTTNSNTATFTITINPMEDNPLFVGPISVTAWNEDTTKTNAFDLDNYFFDVDTGEPCAYSILDNPTPNIIVSINESTHVVSFTPNANWNGAETVQFRCTDTAEATVDSNSITLTVNAMNDAPIFTGSLTVAAWNEDVTKTNAFGLDDYFSDIDAGDSCTYSIIDNPITNITAFINPDTHFVTFLPQANWNGSDTVQFRCTDSQNASVDSNSIGLTVNPVNDAPTVADASGGINENTTLNGDLNYSDFDGDSVIFSIVTNGSHGTATITNTSTGVFNFVPNPDYNGTDTFTYKVNDGFLDSNTATFTISVNEANEPPIFTGPIADISWDEDTAKTNTIDLDNYFSDPNISDSCTYSIIDNPTPYIVVEINSETHQVSFATATTNWHGTDTVQFRCTDEGLATVDSNVANLIVSPVNDAPQVTAGLDQTISEDNGSTSLLASVSDVDSADIFSYTWLETSDFANACSIVDSQTAGPTINVDNETSNYNCTFSVVVNDSQADSNTDTVNIFVNADDDPPIMVNIADKTIEAGDTLTFAVGANDADTAKLSMDVVDTNNDFTNKGLNVKQMFLDNNNNTGTFYWQPESKQSGTYVASFSAYDGTTTSIDLVNITVVSEAVTNQNNKPVFAGYLPNVSFFANHATKTLFNLNSYFSDADSDTLTYSATGNTKIKVFINNGEVSMSAPANFQGSEKITFMATDGKDMVYSNAIYATVSGQAVDNIDHATGAYNGRGTVRLYDQDNKLIKKWKAFTSGGAVPKLSVINNQAYVFVMMNRAGTKIRLYTSLGKLFTWKYLMPKLQWDHSVIGNLDSDSTDQELAVATKKGAAIYISIYNFDLDTAEFNLVTTHKINYKPRKYSLNIKSNKTILIKNKTGKVVYKLKP